MNPFDLALFGWLNSWAGISVVFDNIIIFSAEYLGFVLITALFLFLVLPINMASTIRANWRMVTSAVFAGLIARYGVVELIRFFYDKSRPFGILTDINQLILHTFGSAFPSGHAAFFFALAAGVYFYKPRWSIWFFTAASIISISRVIAGIHWPLDILAGAAVGIFSAWIVKVVLHKFHD